MLSSRSFLLRAALAAAGWLAVAALLMAALLMAALAPAAHAQVPYDASWYDADRPYVKIPVTEDGIHRLSGADLQAAGVPLGQIDPSTLRLLEKGDEVPLDLRGASSSLTAGSDLLFVGQRNRGRDEEWAYNGNESFQSSTFRSLYTDTLTYWLTWGGEAGERYTPTGGGGSAPVVSAVRDTVHIEQDLQYHYGDSGETGDPLFTLGEGYYWHALDENSTQDYTLPLPRAAQNASDDVRFTVRMVGRTGSCHRAVLQADFGGGFQTLGEAQWEDYEFATIQAAVPQSQVSGSPLALRVRTFNDGFDELGYCRAEDPEVNDPPNGIFVDFVEAAYTRSLAPTAGTQQDFAPVSGAARTYELSGYGGEVLVLDPATGRRFTPTAGTGGTARFTAGATGGTMFWATATGSYRAPAGLAYAPAGSQPDWTAAPNDAEYVLLTTEMMRATAEDMAAYRQNTDGYSTAVVTVEEVYDQFDYGRATPIAIRRFVHQTQSTWDGPARFLTFWGDATYPIRTATEQPDAPWNVPAFGFAPSDAWYAMQYDGPEDWSEVVALGRVPVRTTAQAQTFINKVSDYEAGELRDWQKRYLALSGGVGDAQQRNLERYSEEWADSAATRPTGMDTIYFSKKSSEALDASFQDSLDAAFSRGAGWLNYFGHSAAQTWEIVTEKPVNFDNADRLPFVVSLGCQTGAFAGGRFSDKPAPSFGEQLVLGLDPDAPLAAGSQNGAIAHFGTSYFGVVGTSADLNDGLIDNVFKDTVRLSGLAVRNAKAREAEGVFFRSTMRKHLMQYNLLGDAATRLNLPVQPNFHVEPAQLTTRPLVPTPSDSLRFTAQVKNQGLVPSDSVTVLVSHDPPGAARFEEEYRLAPFRLRETVSLTTFLTEDMVGVNTVRVEADPSDQIAEAREMDNTAQREVVVSASGLRLVTPRPLGTARANGPVFRLNLSSPTAETVRLQLATDSTFASLEAEDAFEATGPLVRWTPGTALDGGSSYYWRARIETSGEVQPWRTGSFTAQPGNTADAWVQQGEQFRQNTQQQIRRTDGEGGSENGGEWDFSEYERLIQAYSSRAGDINQNGFVIGGGAANYLYLRLGFGVLVMDGEDGTVKDAASFCTYQTDLADNPDRPRCSGYVDGAAAAALLDSFVTATLDEGDYLFVRTRHRAIDGGVEIPESVEETFRHLGGPESDVYSQAIDTLDHRDLWIMQARKGYPDQTVERVDARESGQGVITYETRLPFSETSGQTTTARIGPSQSWDALRWTAASFPADEADRLRLQVLPPAEDGSDEGDDAEPLAETTIDDDGAGTLDLSGIDAGAHPYLRLRAAFRDTTGRTPPQLERWRLRYTPTAELALDQTGLELLPADSLAEGQPATVRAPVVNLTEITSEPVRVAFAATDSSNQDRPLSSDTLAALGPEQTGTAEVRFATDALAGENVLNVSARQRRGGAGGPLVPERFLFNNTLVRNFFVEGDRTAPDVNVTVDGRELPTLSENADRREIPFVSLNPTFEITLEDDSQFLAVDDTTLIDVRFGDDTFGDPPRVAFASEALDFVAPDQPGEEARAVFSPTLEASDSTYTLQVEVEDARGNQPDQVYRTEVRVRTTVAVQDMYPYPNPMSTHTNFMFRLEGSTPSAITECRMRIYTLSGQMVMEMDMMDNPMLVNPDEGGGLRAGWNRVPWDGRDADGDRMGTGVYLYKVFMDGEGDLDVNDGNVEKIAVIR